MSKHFSYILSIIALIVFAAQPLYAQPSVVPTLSEWGVFALGMLIMVAAVVVIFRMSKNSLSRKPRQNEIS